MINIQGNHTKDKRYRKVKDLGYDTGEHRGAAHAICDLKYCVPEEIPIIFHNGCNYDYHSIIKELAEQFEGQFTCLKESN